MAYVPTERTNITDIETLRAWATEEFRAISRELNETTALELRTVHVEPKRPREGMIVVADGTDWNPGAGGGAYVYFGATWVKL